MTPILDDIDARPGSVVSLLRTVVGLYLRRVGGWIAAADLVRLLAELGVEPSQARTGIARLRRKGLLLPERRSAAGYLVNPAAAPMLERGDRRIFSRPVMTEADPWCLISFSISEDRREVRGKLRRRLQWIGAGTVAPGLWICPGYLADEAEQILVDLGAREDATLFLTAEPRVTGTLADAVGKWWDLESLAAEHERFIDWAATVPPAEGALARYVELMDRWRPIPYVDPGLPAALLPPDWPGAQSAAICARMAEELAADAWARVLELTGADTGAAMVPASAR